MFFADCVQDKVDKLTGEISILMPSSVSVSQVNLASQVMVVPWVLGNSREFHSGAKQ